MRKYIFITNCIESIGGGQLYVSRKVEFLKKNNWDVEVYYTDFGEVMIENLKPFLPNHLQVLCVPFELVKEKQREEVVKRFTPGENTIIESHLVHLSIWGEYIARCIGAKHIAYFLCEHFPPLKDNVHEFLKFKKQQNLLYGITDKSIPMLFNEEFDGSPYKLLAVGCQSSVGEDDTRISSLPNADFTILSLGRLDKPYVPHMVASIREFAENHRHNTINLIIIGDSQSRDNLLKPLKDMSNVHMLLMGNMHPVPLNAFTTADVAIATAGSAVLTSKHDVPTISIDENDFAAIGVVGYTTSKTLFRDAHESPIKILDLLKEVLIKKQYPKKGLDVMYTGIDYSAHQAVINLGFDGEYYDLLGEYNVKRDNLTLETLVARFLGWRMYLRYMHFKAVIKKLINKV